MAKAQRADQKTRDNLVAYAKHGDTFEHAMA